MLRCKRQSYTKRKKLYEKEKSGDFIFTKVTFQVTMFLVMKQQQRGDNMTETGSRIKSLMVLNNIKVYELADMLGISEPTLRSRFKDGNFKHREMQILIEVLRIEKPQDVFFKLNIVQEGDE